MKDAVGSSLLVYVVIIVVGIVGSCIIASTAYSKAYRAKNYIISEINKKYLINSELSKETDSNIGNDFFNDTNFISTINTNLNNYKMSVSVQDCNSSSVKNKFLKDDNSSDSVRLVYPNAESGNNPSGYCVFRKDISDDKYYYSIVTFSHLNINVLGIGTLFKTPVYGETRTYYSNGGMY